MKNLVKLMILGLLVLSGILHSCKKEEIPTLTTTEVTSISTIAALSGGNITSEGTDTIIARGVCWSTKISPTINDNKTQDGFGAGTFESWIIDLNSLTTYYVRAYASNSVGTAYGNELSFITLAYLPTVTTSSITNITTNSASGGGNVLSDGGAAVTTRGVCWGTDLQPTINDSFTTDGIGLGAFTSNLTGLTTHTIYYARAYATNSTGTEYGGSEEFITPKGSSNDIIFNPNINYGTLSDVDGNTYKTVQIGTQTWMAENLKTSRYNDESSVPLYSWFNNDINNKNIYGALYNGYAVISGKLCPTGWHVPTDYEWTTLITYLGGANIAGGKLKETGTSHWYGPNSGATNVTGFTALPGGFSADNMTFFGFMESSGDYWTSSESDPYIYTKDMFYHNNEVNTGRAEKGYGLSVRCIKDN